MALDTARNIDWKPVWQGFGRAMSVATMFSVYLSGWVAVAAVLWFGPELAMLLQVLGDNTEPHRATLPWPYGWTFVAGALPVPLAGTGHWRYAALSSLPLVLLPFVQLHRLYLLAGAP